MDDLGALPQITTLGKGLDVRDEIHFGLLPGDWSERGRCQRRKGNDVLPFKLAFRSFALIFVTTGTSVIESVQQGFPFPQYEMSSSGERLARFSPQRA